MGRTREEQSEFRENLYKEMRRTFKLPLFCPVTLEGFKRLPCFFAPKVNAHHIVPYCLTQNNDTSNGIFVGLEFHRLIHEAADIDINHALAELGFETNSLEIDFVSPVTIAMVSANFESLLKDRPVLHEVFLPGPEKTKFVSVWENFLRSKNLLDMPTYAYTLPTQITRPAIITV